MKWLSLILAVLMVTTSMGVMVEPCDQGRHTGHEGVADGCDLVGGFAHDLGADDLHLTAAQTERAAPEVVPVSSCTCLCHVPGLHHRTGLGQLFALVSLSIQTAPALAPHEILRSLYRPPRAV